MNKLIYTALAVTTLNASPMAEIPCDDIQTAYEILKGFEDKCRVEPTPTPTAIPTPIPTPTPTATPAPTASPIVGMLASRITWEDETPFIGEVRLRGTNGTTYTTTTNSNGYFSFDVIGNFEFYLEAYHGKGWARYPNSLGVYKGELYEKRSGVWVKIESLNHTQQDLVIPQ